MGYIYVIKNTENNKIYVGQTTRSIEIRWREHRNDKNRLLSQDIKKFGHDKFIFVEQIEMDNNILDEEENKYINKYDSLYPNGYNIEPGSITYLKLEHTSKGGKSETGHDKQSQKVKEKYKLNPKLKDLPDIPRGISYCKRLKNKNKYEYEGFKVRKVGIKNKEFVSTVNQNKLAYNLERAIEYLKCQMS